MLKRGSCEDHMSVIYTKYHNYNSYQNIQEKSFIKLKIKLKLLKHITIHEKRKIL